MWYCLADGSVLNKAFNVEILASPSQLKSFKWVVLAVTITLCVFICHAGLESFFQRTVQYR